MCDADDVMDEGCGVMMRWDGVGWGGMLRQVLLLHLKRFMFDGANAHKTMTRVEFPDSLSLLEYYSKGTAEEGTHDYHLIGGAAFSPFLPRARSISLSLSLSLSLIHPSSLSLSLSRARARTRSRYICTHTQIYMHACICWRKLPARQDERLSFCPLPLLPLFDWRSSFSVSPPTTPLPPSLPPSLPTV